MTEQSQPLLPGLLPAEASAAEFPPDGPFRFIDLFAGIGGFRLALEAVGGKCVFTSEVDKASRETYKANFKCNQDGHRLLWDVMQLEGDALKDFVPQHDLLVAGFPCQPFSIAGVSKRNSLNRPHGFECNEQGRMFFKVAECIKHHQPAAFLLENVKNLKSHDRGRTFKVILEILQKDLGYAVDCKVINSESWVPQKRSRLFIVGFREKPKFSLEDFDTSNTPPPRPIKIRSLPIFWKRHRMTNTY